MQAITVSKQMCITFLVSALFLFSCSTTRQSVTGDEGDTRPPSPEVTQEMQAAENVATEPEELPPPAENEQDIYKIQVLAVSSITGAESTKEALKKFTGKNIFLVHDKELWKVQIGDFTERTEAEKEMALLKQLGWSDAWIVHVRKASNELLQQPAGEEKPAAREQDLFTIQVIATTNRQEAETLLVNLNLLKIEDSSLIKEGRFWKIHVGKYTDQSQALHMLQRIKEMGFHDSWITKTTIVEFLSGEKIINIDTNQPTTASIYIEILAAQDRQVADFEARKYYLLTESNATIVQVDSGWSVRIGPFADETSAEIKFLEILKLGFRKATLIK
ncbi:SPOR domain-containing protein [candidate division KSB1 bacterium]